MINILVMFLVSAGFFFFLATTVGILRFPDFYSRMHAAGKGDTLSSFLTLLGLALYNLHNFTSGSLLVSIKIMAISVFIFLASPTATHDIIRAGYASGVEPWVKKKNDKEEKNKDEA